jgi:hypothetical protein
VFGHPGKNQINLFNMPAQITYFESNAPLFMLYLNTNKELLSVQCSQPTTPGGNRSTDYPYRNSDFVFVCWAEVPEKFFPVGFSYINFVPGALPVLEVNPASRWQLHLSQPTWSYANFIDRSTLLSPTELFVIQASAFDVSIIKPNMFRQENTRVQVFLRFPDMTQPLV